jgi:hypothetical protein
MHCSASSVSATPVKSSANIRAFRVAARAAPASSAGGPGPAAPAACWLCALPGAPAGRTGSGNPWEVAPPPRPGHPQRCQAGCIESVSPCVVTSLMSNQSEVCWPIEAHGPGGGGIHAAHIPPGLATDALVPHSLNISPPQTVLYAFFGSRRKAYVTLPWRRCADRWTCPA